ncbi:hypothetical protein LCGC14_1453260, partial [marine sediment metagenome]
VNKMLHSERKNYQKKISKLNKDFPSGFKTIDFRMLPDMIKHEIISNKISQMETPEFEEICSMLNFTPEDIQREKQQLEDYLDTLSIKMENTPFKEEKDYDRIKQTESDGLLFKRDIFGKVLSTEYDRLYPLLITLIKKKNKLEKLGKIYMTNEKIINNLDTVMEIDVKSLHNERKDLSLKISDIKDTDLIQKYQTRIDKLAKYVFNYVDHVYLPTLNKHQTMQKNASLKHERFFFTVIDKINEKMENIRAKIMLNVIEFYFDDDLDLHIMVKNIPPSKYPLKGVKFRELPFVIKKGIIRILKANY